MRKIIQIAIEQADDESHAVIYPLADDGTLWRKCRVNHPQYHWQLLPALPNGTTDLPELGYHLSSGDIVNVSHFGDHHEEEI